MINWKPVDERIIKARFDSRFVKLTLLRVYVPTNDAEEEVKDEFFEKLQTMVEETPRHDMLVITGDMNAKVGSDVEGCERVKGRHGVESRRRERREIVRFLRHE